MLQAELTGRLTAALSDCTAKLRGIAVDAAKHLTPFYADAEGYIQVTLADGRNAILHAEKAIVGIENEYASKVTDLEDLLKSVHKLLGQAAPVNTQAEANVKVGDLIADGEPHEDTLGEPDAPAVPEAEHE